MKRDLIIFVLSTISVRLACLRHAASVHPEPGSNSQKRIDVRQKTAYINLNSYHHLIVKELFAEQKATKNPTSGRVGLCPVYQWSYGSSLIAFLLYGKQTPNSSPSIRG